MTSKTKKIGLTAIVFIVLAYFGFQSWVKRWQLFDKDGNTHWGELSVSRFDYRLAIRVPSNHGIKAGDTITVEENTARYDLKEVKVLEVLSVKGEAWLVLDVSAIDGDDFSGRFKLNKRG